MSDAMNSVTDIPGWLSRNYPNLTRPFRMAKNAVMLPLDAGADLLRRGTHAALGLEEDQPYKYSGETAAALADDVGAIGSGISNTAGGALEGLRQQLIEGGAMRVGSSPSTQRAAARGINDPMSFGPMPTEGAPAAAPTGARPRRAPVTVDAEPSGGALGGGRAGGGGALGEEPIDTSRPIINNQDGSFSTERTITVEMDGKHLLLPTIVNGRQVSEDEAVALFRAGKNQPVGVFASAQEADAAAKARSERIGQVRGGALSEGGAQASTRQSLGDRYGDLLAKTVPTARSGALTPDQKKQLELEFFLNLMARGSRPGAKAIGAMGESGLDVSGKVTQFRNKNIDDERVARTEAREDAFRRVGFEDKDVDNQRAVEQLRMQEKHYASIDKEAAERTRIAREQLEQGKWDIKTNRAGQFVKIDKKTGAWEILKDPVTGKPLMAQTEDKTPAELRVLKALQADPELARMYRELHGKREGALTEEALARLYANAARDAEISGKDPAEVVSRAVEFARGGGRPAAGAGGTPGTVSRKDAKYQAALKDPRVGGDQKKLDEMLKSRGVTITD